MKAQERRQIPKKDVNPRPKETERMPPLHPGEVLCEEFMKPLAISQNQLGRDLAVPPRRINEIVHGKRSISADTAVRLALYFGTSPQFWLGLQADYDLEVLEGGKAEEIRRVVKVRQDKARSVAA
jgi:addiction module HigA family antidote